MGCYQDIFRKEIASSWPAMHWRDPDATFYASGPKVSTRLLQTLSNYGVWSVIVLTGHLEKTYARLMPALESSSELHEFMPYGMLRFIAEATQALAGGDLWYCILEAGRL